MSTAEDLKALPSVNERPSSHKIRSPTEDCQSSKNQLDKTDIYRNYSSMS